MLHVEKSTTSSLRRTGHAMDLCEPLRALVMFGGVPSYDDEGRAEEASACQLRYVTTSAIAEHTQNDSPVEWEVHRAATCPRSRAGHFIRCVGTLVIVVGGTYWGFGDAFPLNSLCYDTSSRVWSRAACDTFSHIPKTHASVTPGITHFGGHAGVFVFGGMDESRTLTNSLHFVELPSVAYVWCAQLGDVPRKQFKGSLAAVASSANDDQATVLFLCDGFYGVEGRDHSVHCYTVATCVWQRVCTAPPVVRAPVIMLSSTQFGILGGMSTASGLRTGSLFVFDSQLERWLGGAMKLDGMLPLSAHSCVFVGDLGRRDFAAYVCFGGSEEYLDDTEEPLPNNVGYASRSFFVLSRRFGSSLKELAALAVLQMKIPTSALVSRPVAEKDPLLDELF